MAGTAQAQGFGVESFTGMVFADDQRDRSDAYTNTGGDEGDSYPDDPAPGAGGTGIYELAGGHPFIGVTDFDFNREPGGPPIGGNVERLRVDIPRGLMPNSSAFARCTDEELDDSDCPLDSQIGTEEITLYIGALDTVTGNGDIRLRVPLYNMTPLSNPADTPQRDVPARFGFNPAEAAEAVAALPPIPVLPNLIPGIAARLLALEPVHIVGGVRDEPSGFGPFDYGLFFTIDHLPHYEGTATSPAVVRTNLTFWGAPGDLYWGNPASPQSDDHRGRGCVWLPADAATPLCTAITLPGPAPDPAIPFLSNPTECTGDHLTGMLSVWSQPQGDGSVLTDQASDSTPEIIDVDDGLPKRGAQECQQLTLAPALDLGLAAPAQDSPVGPAVSTRVDQSPLLDREQFAPAHVDDITVTLPPGLTINPSTANGLEACTDEQLAANTGVVGGDACPEASRIGDVRVTSPLLPPTAAEPGVTPALGGSAYVGQPLPGDKYRLFVTVEGRDISIRLKGSVRPDPGTGQVTAIFSDNPQLPFDDLTVDFRDGPRAPLATPLDCEPKVAGATLSPWAGTPAQTAQSDPFSSSGGCPPGFGPSIGAAPASPLGGAITPFTATLARPDGSQYLSSVRVQTPPGLAGYVSRVDECPNAQAATGACPADTRIGTATTWAGAGSEPYRLAGPVYLTDRYKGGQFGMVTVIRAVAGPYDLGTVVVRQTIFVDPEDAHLTVVSDPFPTILDGVPIRLRQVDLSLDTPGFSYNPTSCGAKEVRATLYPVAGGAVDRSTGFDVTSCDRLGFAPRMSMQFVGPRQTRFEGHPKLYTRVTAARGHANIGKVRVALPASIALDPENSQKVCSVADAARADCPEPTRIGFAKAISPALDRPLQGPVYFVQGIRTDPTTGRQIRTLPSLLAKLRGQVPINLRGTTDVVGRNLVSDFGRVPDAPVSDFRLNLRGGKRGPLVISARRGICDRRQVTKTRFTGQNGKTRAQNVNVRKPCRRPMIRLRRIEDTGDRLAVAGTIRPKATKRLRVSVRCGGTRVARAAKQARRGRWRTSLALRDACADAGRAKLRVSYPGGGDFRIAVRKRSVRLSPAGS